MADHIPGEVYRRRFPIKANNGDSNSLFTTMQLKVLPLEGKEALHDLPPLQIHPHGWPVTMAALPGAVRNQPSLHIQILRTQPALTTLPDQGWACTCMFDMWIAAKVAHTRWSHSQVNVQCGSAPILTVLASLVVQARPCNVHLNGMMRSCSCSGKLDAGQGSNHISYIAFNSK